jgi:glycosyltransferase involved in cell wall biosynthesis
MQIRSIGKIMLGQSDQPRVAFLFYPYLPKTTFLSMMPFAAHSVHRLASSGADIDVFVWNEGDVSLHGDYPDNVHFKYVKMPRVSTRMRFVALTLRFSRCITYSCVVSVGLIGSYVAGIVSAASRCPFVLLNDEFPNVYEKSRWVTLQRWAARRANVIVVPSDDRRGILTEEMGLNTCKPFVTLRNTPELILPSAHIDWRQVIGIPHGKKVFIHAGYIGDWAQVPEILGSVSYWPKDAVLLLHSSRSQDAISSYRREISHLDNPGRVFWSSGLLTEDKINSLVGSCNGSFALYRNDGTNTEYIGTSSGKLMRSIVCGTPVITSSFESLKFVAKEGLGIQVRHPAEIPAAVDNLIRDEDNYRGRCARFAESEISLREEAWTRILQYVRRARNGVDLSPRHGGGRRS